MIKFYTCYFNNNVGIHRHHINLPHQLYLSLIGKG